MIHSLHKNQLPIHDLHYIYTFRCLVCPWPFFAGPYTHAERGAVARPIAQTDMPGSCYRILLRLRFRLDHAPHPPRILFFFVLRDREGGIQIAAPSHPELDLELGHSSGDAGQGGGGLMCPVLVLSRRCWALR